MAPNRNWTVRARSSIGRSYVTGSARARAYLRKVASSEESGGWDTLFQDPGDGRYWECTFPRSEMHGGGPKRLRVISEEQARGKYKVSG